MKSNFLLSALFILIILNACSSANDKGEPGTVFYYAFFDIHDALKIKDGGDVVLSAVLEKNLPDSTKNIPLNGKTVYLIFDNEQLIKNNKKFTLPSPDFQLLVAEWFGKDSVNLNNNVKGTVYIREHQEYLKTVIDFDLKIQTGIAEYWNYSGTKEFSCIRHYKKYKGEPFAADSVDIQFDANNLSALRLDGKWTKQAELYFDTQLNYWMEMFYLPEKTEWEIQSGLMIKPKVEEFRVDNGRIFIKDEIGTKEYLINSVKNDSLVITNQLSPSKNRYIFVKKK